MFKKTDPYSLRKFCILLNQNKPIGSIAIEYTVKYYEDVLVNNTDGPEIDNSRKYIITCNQKIKINNPSGSDLTPQIINSFDDYPILFTNQITNNIASLPGVTIQLLEYSPKTINTKVQTSGTSTTSAGNVVGNSASDTIGSSTSQSNSYGASVSLDGMSANAEHSETSSKDQSQTLGSDFSENTTKEASNSESMSVKDWGIYAQVDPVTNTPSWICGQEYPWDIFKCRSSDITSTNPNNPAQVRVSIAASLSANLSDGTVLFPPSQLSLFGLEFIMKGLWLVKVPNNSSSDLIQLQHIINYFTATHALSDPGKTDNTVFAYMDLKPSTLNVSTTESLDTTINLPLMALNPIGNKNAIIGFLPKRFTITPAPAGAASMPTNFKIISSENNLLILDETHYVSHFPPTAGFSATNKSLNASFTGTCQQLIITAYFKILDTDSHYTLFMKHWKGSETGFMLKITINGDTEGTIVKHIDSYEAEGGENNLLSISLRNLDYTSTDFHDYLQLGVNTIKISITPVDQTTTNSSYHIRAISIEQN